MAKQLSDEWLAADLSMWQGDEPAEVPQSYLRMLIQEIQRQRADIKTLDIRIDDFERNWVPKSLNLVGVYHERRK